MPDPVPDKLTDEEREAMTAAFAQAEGRSAGRLLRAFRRAEVRARWHDEQWFKAGYLAARGSVSLPSDKVEVDAKMLDGANRAALSLAEQLESAEARLASLETALRDLLDWAEHIEGEGKFRRTEAIGQARSALSAAPSTGEDEEAAVERVAKALEELLSQHEAGYTFPPPGVVGQGDVRSEAWDAARAAIAAFRGVGEAK